MEEIDLTRHGGVIYLFIGSMYAGKTTYLMKLMTTAKIMNMKVLVIRFKNDLERNVQLQTHNGDTLKFDLTTVISDTDLSSNLLKQCEDYDIICIDEGQFFTNIDTFCDTLANKGKKVIVSALDGDFKRQPFGNIYKLIPMCEFVMKCHSVCSVCHKLASFTMRTTSDENIVIINDAIYKPVCRECYNKRGLN
ncbi:Thymidine kinase [uncultured archaeon]|nr:Thymidine kinase [uncultured archaeon]